MTRRERLMATLQGKPVDRPAVSFYEVGGWTMGVSDDEYNVRTDPSWRSLLDLALAKTDLMRNVGPAWKGGSDGGLWELTSHEAWIEGESRFHRMTINAPGRKLTSLTRQDKDVGTTWSLEHLLKSVEDVEAYLRLPEPTPGEVDVSGILAQEHALGESGIVLIDMADAICHAAGLFSMEDYAVMAMTERSLFHRLLQRFFRIILPQVEQTSKALPGRLWRVCGSEYASEPFLPPSLFDEYVVRYTGPQFQAIQKHGGFARIHSHGRLRGILPLIAKMKPDGIDPLEPPPQGDMDLREIREAIGRDTVLMGNIESTDIENLPADQFERKVVTALREGTAGPARGFVLHPSACPYGRTITPLTMTNYETLIRLAENWGG